MKKIKKFIKSNIKVVIAFILGISIAGSIGVYAATVIASSSVSYDNSTSGLEATNLQDALDEAYKKSINSGVPIDPDTFKINSAKTVYVSSKGLCIFRNNKLNCFKNNNWAEEQNHIQEVFSDISCTVNSSGVYCNASDFYCYVNSDGNVYCRGYPDGSDCFVSSAGSVNCR